MSLPHMSAIDAELALAEMHIRREQVVVTNLVPAWFWRSLGCLMVPFVFCVESQVPLLIALGSVGYAIGLSTVIVLVVRRARVSVRPELIGVRGGLAIAGFATGLSAAGVSLGLTLGINGVPFAATIGVVPVAVGLAVLGPRLMSYLRKVMLSRPLAG